MVEHSFQDAQDMQRLSPVTFKAPTPAELATVEPGVFVQVCVGGEQFWTKVTGVSGQLVGAVVRTRVRSIPSLRHGDHITFEHRHIYRIQQEEPITAPAGRRNNERRTT